MKMRSVYVDRERRFSFVVDEETGKPYVAVSVANSMVEYDERYAVDDETFERFVADPALSLDFVAKAKNRELDHLLLLQPGRDRGFPTG